MTILISFQRERPTRREVRNNSLGSYVRKRARKRYAGYRRKYAVLPVEQTSEQIVKTSLKLRSRAIGVRLMEQSGVRNLASYLCHGVTSCSCHTTHERKVSVVFSTQKVSTTIRYVPSTYLSCRLAPSHSERLKIRCLNWKEQLLGADGHTMVWMTMVLIDLLSLTDNYFYSAIMSLVLPESHQQFQVLARAICPSYFC